MKTQELIVAVAKHADVTQVDVRAVFKALRHTIETELQKDGGVVAIPSVCKFKRVHYAARKIKDFKGKTHSVPARHKVKIIPLDGLKKAHPVKKTTRRGK